MFVCLKLAWGFKPLHAQDTLFWGSVVAYSAAYTGLWFVWYNGMPQTRFHFFNDWKEWLQMDKAGHLYAAFQQSRLYLQWQKDKKRWWLYGSMGFLSLLPLEIMDGFMVEWGASWGDLVANATGALLATTLYATQQQHRWSIKYSYHPERLSDYYPKTFGENLAQKIFKDYNGQTYWLCWAPIKKYPWIGIALGYGAANLQGSPEKFTITPFREYYFGLDINLRNLPVKKRWLKTLFWLADAIRLPLPTLAWDKQGFRGYLLYF